MAGTIGSFGKYVAPEKVNPYATTLVEFAKAADEDPSASWTIELDAAKETVERIKIAEAANAIGKTARMRERDDSARTIAGHRESSGKPIYAGKVTLTFTLSEIHKPRKGAKDVAESAPAETEKATKNK